MVAKNKTGVYATRLRWIGSLLIFFAEKKKWRDLIAQLSCNMVRRGGWDVVIDKRIKRSALVFVTLLIAGGCENESTPSPDGGGGIQGDSGAHPNGDAGMPMGDAGTDGGSGTDEAEITMGRLIVADSASPSVRVIDLDDASVFDSMSLASTARVYGNSSGRYAYAVQADGDRVTIFSVSPDFGEPHEHDHTH